MFKAAKITGLNSDQLAASAVVIDRQPDTSYLIILSVISDEAFSRLRQTLSSTDEILDELSDQSTAIRLKSLQDKLLESFAGAEQVSILVAALNKQSLYILRKGLQTEAHLLRHGQSSDLTKLAAEGQLISGFLQVGDRVVLSNNAELSELKELPLETLEEEPVVQFAKAKNDPVAAVVLDFADQLTEAIPEAAVQDHPLIENDPIVKKLLAKLRHGGGNLHYLMPRTRKSGLIAGLVLLAVVVGGVGLSYQYRKNELVMSRFTEALTKAQGEYDQALALKDLDPAAANQHLNNAKQELDVAESIKPKQKSAQQMRDQINNNSGAILKVVQVRDFPVWLDLDLIKKNFSTKNLSLSVGRLLVLDADQKSLVVVDLEKKSNQILAGGDKLGKAKLAALNGDMAYVYSEDRGVVKVELPVGGVQKDPTSVIKPDLNWGLISDVYAFAGNLYMVDEFKNAVWKYIPTVAGFSDARNYLAEGVKVDFAGVSKMQIDSSVWVLKNDGELIKFTQGVRDHFSYSGLDKPINKPKSFFLSDETDNLYLLDSGNSRLLVLDKKGAYLGQYQGEQFKNFTDLVVDEDNKKVYLLLGQKLFQMDLF